jgi:hypothetical protein
MNPMKSSPLDVSFSCLHLVLQIQPVEVTEWNRSPLENLRLHPLLDFFENFGGFRVNRSNFGNNGPFFREQGT